MASTKHLNLIRFTAVVAVFSYYVSLNHPIVRFPGVCWSAAVTFGFPFKRYFCCTIRGLFLFLTLYLPPYRFFVNSRSKDQSEFPAYVHQVPVAGYL